MKLNLENTRAIIFDLGGVLINIDYSLTEKAIRALGIPPLQGQLSQAKQFHLFDSFEKGQLSPESFREELQTMLPENRSHQDIDKAWNAMLLDFPEERLQLLQKLGKKYRLFLLSNTNSIHIDEMNRQLMKVHAIHSLQHFFEEIFYSFEVGMRKPDAEIFEHVLISRQLIASETLFIDDSPQHIQAANAIGIPSYLLEKGMDICTLF